jgi:hypothetical protein
MAAYIAIARGQVPRTLYFRLLRTPPPADTSQEMTPEGQTQNYLGVDVYEGHYQYNFFSQAAGAWLGIQVVPSQGGSMFEALMVPLFIPEERWAPDSWGRNHRCYVQAQIDHGMTEAAYGYWGFSPSNDPFGGYREWGVDAIGIDQGVPQLGAPQGGYFSDKQNTGFNYGRVPPTQPRPQDFGNGVVTSHVSFLAMREDRASAVANLAKLRQDFPRVYDWGGFYDAIDVKGGRISQYYLSLDQGMIMAAIADVLTADDYSRLMWTDPQIAIAIPSLLQRETFSIEAFPRCEVA